MKIPKVFKTEEEVKKEYARSQDDRMCTGLTHQIDTSGSCQCGYYIDGEPGGTFPFVPNRATRRSLGERTPKTKHVRTDEEIQRMKNERTRNDKLREDRAERRRKEREARDALREQLGIPFGQARAYIEGESSEILADATAEPTVEGNP